MDPVRTSLADEARVALARAHGGRARHDVGAIRSERVRDARRRFLPYVVAGAAVACGYLGAVVAGNDNLAVVFGVAITAGIVAGMALGWVTLALYRRWVERTAPGRRRVDLAIVLLTLPAYLVAGWVSAWAGWAVAVALSQPAPEPDPPNAWVLLIYAAVAIYPLGYLFARLDSSRPEDFAGAVLAAAGEIREQPRSWSVLGAFLIFLAWAVGTLSAVFGVLIGVQVIFRDYLSTADPAEPLLAIAVFVVWIGLTVAGTARTLRWIDRRRSRAP